MSRALSRARRLRSEDQETESTNTRVMRRGAVTRTKVPPRAIGALEQLPERPARRLATQVVEQLDARFATGRHLTVEVVPQTWDGKLAFGTALRSVGWNGYAPLTGSYDQITLPSDGYDDLHLDLEVAEPDDGVTEATVEVLVNGSVRWAKTADVSTGIVRAIPLGPLARGDVVTISSADGLEVLGGTVTHQLVDRPVTVPVEADRPGGAYWIYLHPNGGQLILDRLVHGESKTIVASESFSHTDDVWYGIRASVVDDRIRARIWAWDDPEPASWLLDYTDSDPLADGYTGVGGQLDSATQGNRQCDQIEIAHDGAAAQATDFSEYPSGVKPSDWLELAGQASSQWEVRDDAAATGGKILSYTGNSTGSWIGWSSPGTGRDVEVVGRFRVTSKSDAVGLVLRGTEV